MITQSIYIVLPLAAFLGLIGMLAGQIMNRGKQLDGKPVAPGVLPAALALSLVPIVAAVAMGNPLVGLYVLPMVVLLLGAALGARLRRGQAKETPPAHFRRFDVAAGILALNPILRIAALVATIALHVRPQTWIPIPLLLIALFWLLRTRPADRPAPARLFEIAIILVIGLLLAFAPIRLEARLIGIGMPDVVGLAAIVVTIVTLVSLGILRRKSLRNERYGVAGN